jgi:phospholipid/cholesterol/gamma-HCH transport system substrate-binding protein
VNPSDHSHEGGLSVRDQIERYRTAFIAVVTMFVIAVAVGGYILAHENLHLPSWVPVLGHDYYDLKAEFVTAQAVTPGQGQAVTIAGAKVGEVASVELHNGIAVVSMKVAPKYARFYKNATLLLRPKTQLQDITIEVNPGDASAGKLNSGETVPLEQTAPNVNFDEFLAGLDAETRAYLQLLLAGAGKGFENNGTAFAATLKRFEPAARLGREIQRELAKRSDNISRSIHNFRLLTEALGSKDKQVAELVDSSNAVFQTFAKEQTNFEATLKLLPGALHKTGKALGKVGEASDQVTPALIKLNPFAKALAPAQEAGTKLAIKTAPIIENEIRPFAREILPTVNELGPSTQALAESFPHLAAGFSVLNEFFNELAFNPGKGKAGFGFFLAWANHNLNSVVSNSDARGTVGRSLIYFNCKILPILSGVAEVNENVSLLIGLLRPPTKQECDALGLGKKAAGTGRTASARTGTKITPGPFGNLTGAPFSRAGRSAAHAKNAAKRRAQSTATPSSKAQSTATPKAGAAGGQG